MGLPALSALTPFADPSAGGPGTAAAGSNTEGGGFAARLARSSQDLAGLLSPAPADPAGAAGASPRLPDRPGLPGLPGGYGATAGPDPADASGLAAPGVTAAGLPVTPASLRPATSAGLGTSGPGDVICLAPDRGAAPQAENDIVAPTELTTQAATEADTARVLPALDTPADEAPAAAPDAASLAAWVAAWAPPTAATPSAAGTRAATLGLPAAEASVDAGTTTTSVTPSTATTRPTATFAGEATPGSSRAGPMSLRTGDPIAEPGPAPSADETTALTSQDPAVADAREATRRTAPREDDTRGPAGLLPTDPAAPLPPATSTGASPATAPPLPTDVGAGPAATAALPSAASPVPAATTSPRGAVERTGPSGRPEPGLDRPARAEPGLARAGTTLSAPDDRAGASTGRGADAPARPALPALPATEAPAAGSGSREPAGAAEKAPASFSAWLDGAVQAPPQAHAAAVPTTAAAPAQGPAVEVPTPVTAPEFREALGVQVSVLARDGVQQAELHLNPTDMGPISVRIEIDGQQAQVSFGVDHATTRAIVEAGLPELASALREAGLTLTGGGVSDHARGPGSEAAAGDTRDGRAPQERPGGRRGDTADDARDSPPPPPRRVRLAGGVDLYA